MGSENSKEKVEKVDHLLLLGRGSEFLKKFCKEIHTNGDFITGKIGNLHVWAYLNVDNHVQLQVKHWHYLLIVLNGIKVGMLCFDQTEDLLSNEMKHYITTLYGLKSFSDLIIVSTDVLTHKMISNLNYLTYLWYPNRQFKIWSINLSKRNNDLIKYIRTIS
jgi:hypothetical protein